ncbi:isocitrate lyase/PEP mutase family protein [Leucobacter allii]|uniref:Isocitrate lyase/PEP mutase family protein n=1 Tax=Leucobacter allii TaxID=2932247 RepID=A0ABY4FML6_9MICO|nr:isocitrate lyase/PEP mutase family protein [Leucobacter allii]UOQ57523.1 isocitrate lyase/PEP mutase family protein [Leucobacter allii]
MAMTQKKTTRLKALFKRPETVIMPFGVMPIHAQMAEAAGFEAFEVSGGISAFWYGVPDVGILTMTEFVDHCRRVARSVDIPVFCDADTGFGPGPASVRRTVHEFIDAGVAGIHIEDQADPKKAGGQTGIALVSDEEAIGRLNAACDARDELDEDFVIVARTDGYGAGGGSLEEAIRRGKLYAEETDADVIFYEGLHTWEQIRTALAETPKPAYVIPSFTLTSRPSMEELSAMGQSIDVTPFIYPAVGETWRMLLQVREANSSKPLNDYMTAELERRGTELYGGVGDNWVKPSYQQVREMEEKYLPASMQRDYVNNPNVND